MSGRVVWERMIGDRDDWHTYQLDTHRLCSKLEVILKKYIKGNRPQNVCQESL